mgnify:CR=1 FL=1
MAAGDIIAAAVSGSSPLDGWVLELTVEAWGAKDIASIDCGWTQPDNDRGNDLNADTPKCVLVVTSEGYDESGSTTTVERTIYGTKRVRQAHPNQALFDTTVDGSDLIVRIALSEYVFSPDTGLLVDCLAGLVVATDASESNAVGELAATNNSTKDYPKVKAAWIDRASTLPGTRLGSTYEGAVFAAHAYGVACAKFVVSDESTSVEEIVAAQSSLECERTASGTVPSITGYQASLSLASLTDGDVGAARVIVYPRIGDASSLFDSDDFGSGSPHLRSRPHRIRASANFPNVYVYVDTANGDNGTCVASTDPATARAAPAAHTWDAVKKARDFINTTYARANSADGIIVRLMDNAGADQNFEWGRTGFASTMTAPACGLIFEPDPLNVGAVAFTTDNNTSNNYLVNGLTLLRELNIAPVSGDQSNYIGRATATDWYVLDRCVITSASTSTGAPLFQSDVSNVTRYCCRNENWYSAGAWGGVFVDSFNYRGKVGANGGFAIGWKLDSHPTEGNWTEVASNAAIANSVAVSNLIFAFFELSTLAEPAFNMASDQTNCYYGHAVVRRYSNAVAGASGTQPLGDMITTPMSDVLMEHLTIVGGRFNLQNQASPNRVQERVYMRNCFHHYFAVKADTFAADGTLTGGWPVLYGVAQSGNYNGEADVFEQEFEGINAWSRRDEVGDRDQGLEDPDFDATPSSGSQLLGLPIESFWSFDFDGTAFDETPDSGAVQTTVDVVDIEPVERELAARRNVGALYGLPRLDRGPGLEF